VLGVTELEKEHWEECPHCGETGCIIYTTRPEGCRKYKCMWLTHPMPNESRPDLLGIIVDISEHAFIDGACITVRECVEGALETEMVQFIIKEFAATQLVLVLSKTFRRLYGPKELVQSVARANEK